MKAWICGVMIAGSLTAASAHMTKYGVEATFDKATNFARLKTYHWTPGWSAWDESVDQQIVRAVDRELTRRGFVDVGSAPSDVVVTYAAVQRRDVDPKLKVSQDPRMYVEYPVGILVVLLRDPVTGRELLKIRGDVPLGANQRSVSAQVNGLIVRMFEEYPSHKGGHH